MGLEPVCFIPDMVALQIQRVTPPVPPQSVQLLFGLRARHARRHPANDIEPAVQSVPQLVSMSDIELRLHRNRKEDCGTVVIHHACMGHNAYYSRRNTVYPNDLVQN